MDEPIPTWPRKAPTVLALLLLSLQSLRQGLEERSSSLSLSPTPGAGTADCTAHPLPRPIPKHLHTPGSNGRYSTVQCRISHSSLTSLLRDWSSFVLVEGYSYVKLLSRWVP